MKEKRPIDIKRERGGGADIGTKEDGAIIEMFKLGNRLIIIKEKSVYEFNFADDIDPERKHPNLPSNTQKLILDIGTDSIMFSRIFLTAKNLFKAEYLSPDVNAENALNLTLEAIQEFKVLEDEINEYLTLEKGAIEEYEERKGKPLSHAVPSVPNLTTRCKTIFQKVDHISQIQMDLIRMFFPDFSKKRYYSHLPEFIEEKFGKEDMFTQFTRDILYMIELTRNIRNCLDHRRTEITIQDFELQVSSDIFSPTIEMNYNGRELERISLSAFLENVMTNLIQTFENFMPYLCSKKTRNDSIMPVEVSLIPEDRRRNKNIKYAYWSPLGDGGYFHQ
jgi:hypothetical protein